jgi:short-subunit dehydrogenase
MRKLNAIVTGASEGLGKAFALELASRQMNLILVALPNTRLNHLANFIRLNFSVDVITLELDLTLTENIREIFTHLKANQLTADVLINNAGMGCWSWFEDNSIEFYKKQIDLNITSTVLLSHLFLEQVNPQNRSYLLNVGSLGGQFILPQKQVYGATKSFISYFTKSLQLEQAAANINISLLSPGGINTKPELLVRNHNLKGVSKLTILEAEEVAREAVNGLLKGKKEIVPGIVNRFLVFLNRVLPTHIKEVIIRKQVKTARYQPELKHIEKSA